MLNKEQLELEILVVDLRTAQAKYATAMARLRPSQTYPVNITLDGSRWVCTLFTDSNPLKCVTAYGNSPSQACENFDLLWMGNSEFLIDQEDELEEF